MLLFLKFNRLADAKKSMQSNAFFEIITILFGLLSE